MQKDVIYIDVDDDITTVIGKVKVAKHKIVALVPPTRVGMLQSAVNLRLINRAAEQKDKKLVLISNNPQLLALAGMTGIPVAKTLQSKPELAPIDALDIDDGEEIIDGSELPIGEHASQAEGLNESVDIVAASSVGAAALTNANRSAAAVASPNSTKKPRVKNGKVPNFDVFRKRLVLIIVAGLLLIGFLIWAIFFAPHANIIVKMRTTDAAVSQQVTLSSSAETSAKNSIIQAETKQLKKDVSVAFVPTGKKNVGEKATGSVRVFASAVTILVSGLNVPAGTTVTSSSGEIFLTTQAAKIERADSAGLDGVVVGVKANGPGEGFNGATGPATVKAAGVSSAKFETATSGGTDRNIKTATKEDIDKAEAAAQGSVDKNIAKSELEKQFGDAYVIVKDSLQVDASGVKSNVGPDEEIVGDSAKVVGAINYSLFAVEKTELKNYLKTVLEQQLDNPDEQRVYSTGVEAVSFTGIDKSDKGITANLSTNGSTGPNITEENIKKLAKGKRYGEVKSSIEQIEGVESADVEFSAFWVRKVPSDDGKITVEFKVNGTQ